MASVTALSKRRPTVLNKRKRPPGLISSNTGLPGAMKPVQKPVQRPIGQPLRRPGVSPVAKISKIATKPQLPQLQRPGDKGKQLNKRKKPIQGGAQSESAPEDGVLKKRKRPGASGGGGMIPPADEGQQEEYTDDAPLPYDASSMMTPDEEQAYYEQSADAEVPIQDGVFTVNNPPATVTPAPSPGLWKRIKAWFADIFAGEEGLSAPLSSAHIVNNVMHVASIVINEDGAHYVVTRIPCPAARGKYGSVNMGAETNPEWLDRAIDKARYVIANKADQVASERHIADVVDRARAGDQNAMALISMVRANAQKGNPRAIASERAFRNYMDKHPAESSMGSELVTPPDANRAKKVQTALVFANGRHLDSEVLRRFGSSFGEEAECFFQGARDWNKNLTPSVARSADPYRLQVYEIGQVLGRARAMQQMRRPEVPISSYDPQVGWELGE